MSNPTVETIDRRPKWSLSVCPFLGQQLDQTQIQKESSAVDSAACLSDQGRFNPTSEITSQPETGQGQRLGNGGMVQGVSGR